MKRLVGVYARISLDRTGESESPERQVADCEEEALRRRWAVADRYVDRDVSAFKKGIRRPQYERLLRDLRSGRLDAVIVWRLDRLTRQGMRGIHEFTEVLGENVFLSVTEPFLDTTTPMGRAILVLIASLAEQESENTSLRVRRAQRSAAKRGQLHRGGYRPFGMTRDGAVVEPEAAAIREAMGRVIQGESLRAIAYDFNRRNIATSTGGQWRSRTLAQVLKSPRLAALREYEGELVPGTWEPVISQGEHLRLLSALDKSLVERREATREHLLSGVVTCGLCDQPMRHMKFRMKNGRLFTRYQCLKQPGHDNCGRLAITSRSTDEHVAKELLDRLSGAQRRPPNASQGEIDALEEELAEDQQGLQDLVHERFVVRTISQVAFASARDQLEQRIEASERRLGALVARQDSFSQGLPLGDRQALQAFWDEMSPEQRKAVVRERILRVTVKPAARRGGNKFDASRLVVEFRCDDVQLRQ
jgi:DNA invertase Pin-like site-specific DNA recombinase